MGNCYYCEKCLEKENENQIFLYDHNNIRKDILTSKKKSQTIIELCITDGLINFNWTFYKYQYISEIVDRIKRETNNRKEIQLISNCQVLPMNKKIGDYLKNEDLVIFQEIFMGGKYFN